MERRSLPGLLLVLAAARAAAFDLTTCGGAVQAGEIADLRADLVCPPLAAAVALTAGSTLNLNGHTISGTSTTSGTGIQCGGRRSDGFCVVHGPGLITNFGVAVVGGGASLRLEALTARGNGSGLAHKAPRLIELVDVDMSDNAEYGITARGGRMRLANVTANHNGIGGVLAPVVKMAHVTAIGNGRDGGVFLTFKSHRATRIIDSTITGNDGLGQGFDLLTTRPVRLMNTTCARGARVRTTSDGGVETTTIVHRLGCAED